MSELSPEAEARDMELVPTRTGRGPFVSGLRAAAKAAVGLRHRPAGQVFSKKKMGGGTVFARRQKQPPRGRPPRPVGRACRSPMGFP